MIERHLRKHRFELVLGSLLAVASAALSMAMLLQLNALVGSASEPTRSTALAVGAGLVVAMLLTSLASQSVQARFAAGMMASLRNDLSRRLLALRYETLVARKRATINALIVDISRIAPLMLLAPQFFLHAITVLFCLCLLAYLSLPLFSVFAVFMVAAVAYKFFVHVRTAGIFNEIREEENTLYDHIAALADGKKELTFNRARADHFLRSVLEPSVERNRRLMATAHRWWGFGEAWTIALVYAATFVVIYLGQTLYPTSSVTTMQFVIIALFMHGPLGFLIGSSSEIAVGLSSLRHLRERGLDELPAAQPSQAAAGLAPAPGWRTIKAHRLTYTYPGNESHAFKLGPVDLEIRRGETLFIVGGNGSGKSTLALLLSGLLTPSSGHIEVDGAKVAAANAAEYHALFTGVFIDFHLFRHVVDRTGAPVADAVVNAWLKKLDIQDSVASVGSVLSTLNLSQGQRKRLALAQGYIDDSDIYVFDEWAADQDPQFRRYFYEQLLPELKQRGKTVLVITHDERFFGIADRTVWMEQGQLQGQSDSRVRESHANVSSDEAAVT
jgi:putative ATP-binding cassette transporter